MAPPKPSKPATGKTPQGRDTRSAGKKQTADPAREETPMEVAASRSEGSESDNPDSHSSDTDNVALQDQSALLEIKGDALLDQTDESDDEGLSPTTRIDSYKNRLLTMKKELKLAETKLKKANEKAKKRKEKIKGMPPDSGSSGSDADRK